MAAALGVYFVVGLPVHAPALSVVIPAFNERERLPTTLAASLAELHTSSRECPREHAPCFLPTCAWPLAGTWEVIVVDDGSTDGTSATIDQLQASERRVRLVRSAINHGKGAAVAAGVRLAEGERILLMDADGGTPVTMLPHLERVMDRDGCGVVVGERCDERPWNRRVMGAVFRMLAASCIPGSGVLDTQCGFKLLSRDAGRVLPHLHVERWAYDVEMLYLAQRLGLGISATRVDSTDVLGSKIRWWTPAQMLLDVLRIRIFYGLGLWEVPWLDGTRPAVSGGPRRQRSSSASHYIELERDWRTSSDAT